MSNKTSVVAIITNGYKQVLVGKKESTFNDLLSGVHEFPGGRLIQGETLYEAIKREVKEETNLYINGGVNFCMHITSKGTEVYWWFIDSYFGELKAGSDLEEVKFVNVDDVFDMCKEAQLYWPKEVMECLRQIKGGHYEMSTL